MPIEYETDIRNFVEPIYVTPNGPPYAVPSRAAVMPPDIPSGSLIRRVRMTNNYLWGANSCTWSISYDRGGMWTKQAGYPADQYGTFHNLMGLVYLNSTFPQRIADSGVLDPPIVYRPGDLFIVDLASNGGELAQPTWEVEFSVPYGSVSTSSVYAFGPTTVGGDNGLNTGLSIRVLSNPIGGSWSQARVTLMGGLTTGMACQNVSIGIQSSGANTVATPVEMLFGGNHGFGLTSPGAMITSDWCNIPIVNGNTLIVVCDCAPAVASSMAWVQTDRCGYLLGGSPGSYFKGSTQSYAQATVTGFSSTPRTTYGLYSIEVR